MRSHRVAEWLLTLVAPSDRATAICGDLAEDAQARGALCAWILYAGLARAVYGIGLVMVDVAWTITYMATNRIAGDVWTELLHFDVIVPPPQWLVAVTQMLAIGVVAPPVIGYLAAERWRERAVPFVAMAGVTWSVLMLATPAVYLVGGRVSPTLVAVVPVFVFAGLCLRRHVAAVKTHA